MKIKNCFYASLFTALLGMIGCSSPLNSLENRVALTVQRVLREHGSPSASVSRAGEAESQRALGGGQILIVKVNITGIPVESEYGERVYTGKHDGVWNVVISENQGKLVMEKMFQDSTNGWGAGLGDQRTLYNTPVDEERK